MHGIIAAATDAVFQLKQEFTKQLVHLPKKVRACVGAERAGRGLQVEQRAAGRAAGGCGALVSRKHPPSALPLPGPSPSRPCTHVAAQTRDMPLSEFKRLYPDDFKSGALAQIGEKFAAMQQELATKQVPATGRGARTAAKRQAEPETVLRTTRRRAAPQARQPPSEPAAEPSGEETQRGRSRVVVGEAAVEPRGAVRACQALTDGRVVHSRAGSWAGGEPTLSPLALCLHY